MSSFYMPARVYDEPDAVTNHAEDMARLGTKALIVTGKHSAKACGALDDAAAALGKAGLSYSVFSDIEENPSVDSVAACAAFGLSEGADFVIGIGGGSPMDASKAVAFLMKLGDPSPAALYDSTLPAKAFPVVCIPTTCGTGSEVTGVSVLTRRDKNVKGSIPHRIFADLALLDARYLRSASISVIRNTAIDAFAHMTESFLMKKSDDFSRAAVIRGLEIWGGEKDVLTGKRPAEDEDLRALLRASALAGIAIAQTGTSIPHALSYVLTCNQNIPHGRACAYFLPGFISRAAAEDKEAILSAAGFDGISGLEAMMCEMFPKADVTADTLEQAYESLRINESRLKSSRLEMNEEVLRDIVYGGY